MRSDEHIVREEITPHRRGLKLELFYYERVGSRSYLRITRLGIVLILIFTVLPVIALLSLFLLNRQIRHPMWMSRLSQCRRRTLPYILLSDNRHHRPLRKHCGSQKRHNPSRQHFHRLLGTVMSGKHKRSGARHGSKPQAKGWAG